ncbi:Mss4-like protein [Pavlovales sp. CCMP2436]|nr:Mss4-like protein [Pavlovales sp. CCMP2436]
MSAAATPEVSHRGTCFCQASSVQLRGDPVAASFCHCSTCRRLSGAPYMAIALAPLSCVVMTGPTSEVLSTSDKVVRYRCSLCHSPLAAILAGKTVALPIGLFDFPGGAPPSWRPQHHMYYSQRTFDVLDGLPRYEASTRGKLWEPPAS